jgi:hypothetical protein
MECRATSTETNQSLDQDNSVVTLSTTATAITTVCATNTQSAKPSCLLVPYKVAEIKDKGRALVATAPIKCGECIFKPNPKAMVWFTSDQVQKRIHDIEIKNGGGCDGGSNSDLKRTHDVIADFLSHLYGWGGHMIELLDDSRFTNHSANPNMMNWRGGTLDGMSFAKRDIAAGEELTENYAEYDCPQWYVDICKKYKVMSTADVVKTFS